MDNKDGDTESNDESNNKVNKREQEEVKAKRLVRSMRNNNPQYDQTFFEEYMITEPDIRK